MERQRQPCVSTLPIDGIWISFSLQGSWFFSFMKTVLHGEAGEEGGGIEDGLRPLRLASCDSKGTDFQDLTSNAAGLSHNSHPGPEKVKRTVLRGPVF